MIKFSSGKPVSNPFYTRSTSSIGEPEIRDEIKKLILTEERGLYFIYRRARRDDNGAPILSPTRQNNRSRETNFDIPTNASETMGYLFDDIPMRGLLNLTLPDHLSGRVMMPGDIRSENQLLYLPYDALSSITGNDRDMPDSIDQIIVPKFDIEGVLLSPLEIDMLFNITAAEAFRLDGQGRVEFYSLSLMSKNERTYKL